MDNIDKVDSISERMMQLAGELRELQGSIPESGKRGNPQLDAAWDYADVAIKYIENASANLTHAARDMLAAGMKDDDEAAAKDAQMDIEDEANRREGGYSGRDGKCCPKCKDGILNDLDGSPGVMCDCCGYTEGC